MKLGLCHVRNKRSDKHGRFTLADEGGSSSDDGFGTRNSKTPEYKGGELDDEPLDETDKVQDLDEGDEEDDGGDDAEEEVCGSSDIRIGEESNTRSGKTEKISSTVTDEAEDVVSNTSSQDKETNDVLSQHAADNSAPVDSLAIATGGPEDEDEDGHTAKTDSTVLASVVGGFLRDKRSDEDSSNSNTGTNKSAELGGDHVVDDDSGPGPDELDGIGDVATGDMPEEQTKSNGEPDKEGNNPVLVVVMQDE